MKWFFLCPLIALLVSINSISGKIFSLYPIDTFYIFQNCLSLFEILFWFSFFLQIIKAKKARAQLTILLAITLIFAFYLLFLSKVGINNIHILALTAICKTVFCIFFFYKLFKNLFYQNILKEPAFWIVTGLIFYSTLSLPFYGLNSYLKFQFSRSVSSNFFSVSNMLIIIMHLFFIKAYLCTIRVYRV